MAVEVLNDENFGSTLKNSNKSVVKYMAGWCGSCRLFAPKFKRMSEDAQFENINFYDVDAEKSPEARKVAGVTTLPFFAIFEGDKLVDSVSSAKEEKVVELLEKLK